MKKLFVSVLSLASISLFFLLCYAQAGAAAVNDYAVVEILNSSGQPVRFPIKGFSHNITNQGTGVIGGGAVTGKAIFGPAMISKDLDSMSPILLVDCASGRHIPYVDIIFFTSKDGAAPTLYFKIHLNDVTVASIDIAETSNVSDPIQEIIKLNYTRIRWITPTGQYGWDLGLNNSF